MGFNVVERLVSMGRQVILADRIAPREQTRRALARHPGHALALEIDLRDGGGVSGIFERNRIEDVIHCAAVTSGPEREASDPWSVVEVNIRATIHVLEAARRHGVRRVVFASSSTVYGESAYRLSRLYEDDSPPLPITLYGITKLAAERICVRLRELWRLDVVAARLGTVIGPWEWNTGARDPFGTHSQLARLALSGTEAILPQREVRRDWIYSRDVARGLVALLDVPATRHTVYNLASGREWGAAIQAWCETLRRAYPAFRFRAAAEGESPNVFYTDRDRAPMDVARLAELGFEARPPASAYADFIEWLGQVPDFWSAKL